jgi:Sulfotransferase domain
MMLSLPTRIVRWAKRRCLLMPALAHADAFIASYPKSGRTWLRFILANYLNDHFNLGLQLNLQSMFSVLPNENLSAERGLPAFRFRDRRGMPLIVVSHARYQRRLFGRKRIIFLLRDPRDLMVSLYFHQTGHKKRFAGGLSEFLRDPGLGLINYIDYLNCWARALREHRHLVVGYEQLSSDPAAVCEAVLGCLEHVPVEGALVQRAVAAAQFDTMQALERKTGIPEHQYDRDDANSLRMRRGKVGGFRDYLSSEDVQYVESALAAHLSDEAQELLHRVGLGGVGVRDRSRSRSRIAA